MSGKPQGLVGLRAESREICSCGILSFSLSKEGRGKGFLESGVHAGLFAGYGLPWRVCVATSTSVDEGAKHISG